MIKSKVYGYKTLEGRISFPGGSGYKFNNSFQSPSSQGSNSPSNL